MMRHGLRRLNSRREDTAIIGDRMDTDIVAGVESEIETILVLSGVTTMEDIPSFPYQPKHILEGIFEIPKELKDGTGDTGDAGKDRVDTGKPGSFSGLSSV
jgi:ribonucleotide monophosphatase NagD (HAD superfamily)